MTARDRVYDDLGEGTWSLEEISIFQIFTLYKILANEPSQKKIIIIRLKQPLDPPLLPIKHQHKTQSLINLR